MNNEQQKLKSVSRAQRNLRQNKDSGDQNNQEQRLTSTSTGGFGNNNNSTSLFGANKTTAGFGSSTNTGGGLFGNSANTATGGFGSSTTGAGFGATNTTSSPFGGAATSTFGGFGSNNNTPATTGFGASQNKPLFGAGGAGTTNAFGTTGGAFGAGNPAGAVAPCQGTGNVPFQAVEEKESNGVTSKYQTISTMEPYQKYSLEELRLADYQGGRQFGNGSGTAGAFGQTNFGGFGNNTTTNTGGAFGSNTGTTGGLFGNTSTAGGAFGSNTATSGGFGANNNTSGGLFGQKPAGGGLFGNNTATPATNTGGLFGNSNTTSTGFGANNTAQSGGLFGNNNQAKPGGLFGNTSTTNTAGGGLFGTNNQQTSAATTGGLFGTSNNTGGGLFGNNNQQQSTGGGLFGTSNNNQQSGGLFGNKTGTGFGNNTTQTPSTGGLFGTTNNTAQSGGLFGNNTTTTNTGGGLFGTNNASTNQQSGGLFGTTQNKPGGLFGTNNTTTGGGLFGTNNNTQPSGGLFNTNNNQQQNNTGGGLFGTSNNQSTGGGLFGNQNQNKTSLFGNNSTNNQNGGLFATSNNTGMFGNSQMNQSQQQNSNQQEVKHASLLDPNPYGQSSIWTGLPTPNEQNSKPLYTPLTATKKMQESAMKPIPSLRLNQSRYNTPPRRGGYGLNYSTYGTPSSVASTPGAGPLSGSLYASRGWSGGGSFGRSFNRSSSVQNLRSVYGNENDDIWKPNAFAPSHRNSSGSIKRLTIDKSIRTDLFNRPSPVPALPAPKPTDNGIAATSTPSQSQSSDSGADPARKLSKRVSWSDNANDSMLDAETGALVRTEDSDEEPSQPARNGAPKNLPAVPEDHESHQVSDENKNLADPRPGSYWMKPTRQEISKMSKQDQKKVKDLQVGRDGCGYVTFNFPIDLTKLNLDNLYDELVHITTRSITVYPDKTSKPPAGQGLNVPSTLVIWNSWPRSKGKPVAISSGPTFDKHIKRLHRVENTKFSSFDPKSGTWIFTVDHYTRYGLDYDDESEIDQSELSLPPQRLAKSADESVVEIDDHTDSDFQEDDTFDFKRLPGQFGDKSGIPIDSESETGGAEVEMSDGSELSEQSEPEYMSEEDSSQQMPGALPTNDEFLFSPIKAPFNNFTVPGTPGKSLVDLDGDWAEQLQRTISPRKQNRDVLREAQSKIALDQAFSPIKPKAAPQVNFKSSVDIMNAIFKPASSHKITQADAPDFEV